MSDRELVGFERGRDERLAISWRQNFAGFHVVDIRVHRRLPTGEWQPTSRGIDIRMSEVFLAANALGEACRLASSVRR